MTVKQSHESKSNVDVKVDQRTPLARWIEDPFASALLATGSTAMAITCVLTGMWVVNVAIS